MICQRIGRPPISTIGFGRTSVSSASLVPSPPARMTTFMISRHYQLRLSYSEPHLIFYPSVGTGETVFERDRRFPTQHLSQSRIVRVASTDALRTIDVVLIDLDSRDIRHHVR